MITSSSSTMADLRGLNPVRVAVRTQRLQVSSSIRGLSIWKKTFESFYLLKASSDGH